MSVPIIKSVKIGKDELNINELLTRDYDDVREAGQILPAAMSWLSWQRAYYQEQLYMAEVTVDTIEGELTLKYKTEGLEGDGYAVKATEGAIDAAIAINPQILEQHRQVGKCKRIVHMLTGHINALERKIELVRTGEATQRRAVEHEPLSDEELENKAHARTTTGD